MLAVGERQLGRIDQPQEALVQQRCRVQMSDVALYTQPRVRDAPRWPPRLLATTGNIHAC
jgi:hypothetical protein